MSLITRQFPRAPSIYGQKFIEQTDLILDLVHDIYRRCYFKNCEIIIPETHRTLVTQTLFDCQFDDCKIVIIQRHPMDTPLNQRHRPHERLTTPVATHIDVRAMEGRPNNLTQVWLADEVKEKLGMKLSVEVMRSLTGYAKLFSHRFPA